MGGWEGFRIGRADVRDERASQQGGFFRRRSNVEQIDMYGTALQAIHLVLVLVGLLIIQERWALGRVRA